MGGRRLRCRAGCRDRKEPPTDSATWFAGGIDRREEHRSHNPRQAHETLYIHDARAIGDDWASHRGRNDPRGEVFRILCLAHVANGLSPQIATVAEKTARGDRLDA